MPVVEALQAKRSLRRQLGATAASLLALIIGCVALSVLFDAEIRALCTGLVEMLGPVALLGVVFFGDVVLTPLSPYLALYIIAHSSLSAQAPTWVAGVIAASLAAGHVGYLIGLSLRRSRWVPAFLRAIPVEHNDWVKKYSDTLPLLIALTPIPYSALCWTAGFTGTPYPRFTFATTLRAARILAIYLLLGCLSTFC